MLRLALAFFLLRLVSPAEELYLFQSPALNRTHIVFSYAGDLWKVPREGGDANRLTTGAGRELRPIFSPDGTRIAFTGEYHGNRDVYVVPVSGGVPKRLTWHPRHDQAVGWTPDGKRILFASPRMNEADGAKLFTMPVEGGFPDEIPLPIADADACYSPDGTHLAYVPMFQWQAAWKRYRGGQTRKIWIADLSDSAVVPIPRDNSNDFNPIWTGGRIYFLSDRNGPVTLYSYDPRTREVKPAIENRGLDFKSASAGPGAIVYEQFGALHLYDLRSGKASPVKVRLAGDLPEVRPRFINVGKRLRNPVISPKGARAAFEARGEILTVPAEKGDPRNLTATVGAHEREPAWSPDGKTLAYLSDESGEYQLHLRDQNGMGQVRRIGLGDAPGFYANLRWSPDSKKIAYTDGHLRLWYLDLDAGKPVLVDTENSLMSDLAPSWSPDSKWLAYRKRLKSHMSAIWFYSLQDSKATQVTDGLSEAKDPVFDKEGKYLYFAASTNSGASMQPDILSRGRTVTSSIYIMVLARDQPSPLAPESDEEKDEAAAEKPKTADKVNVRIDFDNIGQRILALPLPPRRYEGLTVGKPGVLFALEAPAPAPGAEPTLTVHRFDLAKRKSDVPLSGVSAFQVSFNGEKTLYRKSDQWSIAEIKPMPEPGSAPPLPEPPKGALQTAGLEVRVDPRTEWKQMYREAWRIQREMLYDPKYHGLNLKAAEKRYRPYLENLAAREDLNYLFTEMLGELSVSHLFLGGGDSPEVKGVPTGLLGADYRIENGRYRFVRVYNGENWNPDLKAPLTQPGVNVAAGDYLLAVNGRELRGSDNIYSFFENTAGKSVLLRVGADPAGAKARDVTVVPVPDESRLRHLAWIEGNRRKVDQATGGRVAYLHMPDTSFGGYESFNRYFYAQLGKEAAIVDERFNHGGQLATDIIEHLNRTMMSVAFPRDGAAYIQPQGAIFGPKVMIINEAAGSGGDMMPWYFRRAGVGKLIGKRTWGGVVGVTGIELMDGGVVTAPWILISNPEGEYDIENRGVAPDIEVEQDPKAVRQGRDPQLEKAVEVILQELEKRPAPRPKRPAYPNYHPVAN